MSDGAHLLVPFASCASPGCIEARRTLALPHLEKLLARLSPALVESGDGTELSMPHERVLARESGIAAADGRIPWAAWQVAQAGRSTQGSAWARITPCHWRVATDHIDMGHPRQMGLEARDSRDLLAAMRPYFEEDGIQLEYDAPCLWLAHGEIFRELATASLDRVSGRTIDAWMPRAAEAKTLRRLQQEMQMLLYTHEINEKRIADGLPAVNSFWVSGTGALPSPPPPGNAPGGLQSIDTLRDAALMEDWPAWAAAWQQVDERDCALLLEIMDEGQPVSLTLCGERSARTFSGSSGGWARRLGALWRGKRAAAALDAL